MPKTKQQRRPPRTAQPRPAPGELATLQAFLNTASSEQEEPDHLRSAAELGSWLARHGLLDTGTRLGEDDWRRALDVRAGLRASLEANSGGQLDVEAVRRLARAAEGARFELRFDDAGPVGFGPGSRSFDSALGALLAIAATARLEGIWPLFKLCARDGCRRAFFDRSRSHVGKWCGERCGERIRAEAYRKSGRHKWGYDVGRSKVSQLLSDEGGAESK